MLLEGGSQSKMALAKLALANLCLASVALTACFNAIMAFSLCVTLVAAIIKVYKLDPEPFFLLCLHTTISCLMFHDKLQTLAILVALALTCMSAGTIEVSSERIAVFLMSIAFSCLLGHVTSIIAAIGLFIAIVGTKLRPLQPSTNFVLGLLLLAVGIPVNRHATAAVLSPVVALCMTAWCLWKRFRDTTESLYHEHPDVYHENHKSHNNNNDSDHLTLMNGGKIRMSNTTESLDLHGHTVTSALKLLHEFLKEHEDTYRANRTGHCRFLKIITGEDGKNHPEDSMNLVKPTVVNFLKINKYRFQVNPDRPGVLKIDLESHVS